MPYLNIDVDYFDHPKTKRLIALLGKDSDILPLRLWAYCGRFHAEDGILTGYSAAEIESLVCWRGQQEKCVNALLKVGYLEKHDDGYKVHEWNQHEGHIAAFKERSKAANKARWAKYKEDLSNKESNKESLKDATRTPPTIPDHTNNKESAREEKPSAKEIFWDPLKEIFGINPVNPAEELVLYQHCITLQDKGATVPEVRRRLDVYRRQWPKMPVTLKALVNNWDTLAALSKPKSTAPPIRKLA